MDNVKTVVQHLIEKIARRQPQAHNKIDRIWCNLLTEKELKHTRLSGIKEGTVFVLVDSSTWLYQMNMKKRYILSRLKDEIEDITNIHFKLGKWHD